MLYRISSAEEDADREDDGDGDGEGRCRVGVLLAAGMACGMKMYS